MAHWQYKPKSEPNQFSRKRLFFCNINSENVNLSENILVFDAEVKPDVKIDKINLKLKIFA